MSTLLTKDGAIKPVALKNIPAFINNGWKYLEEVMREAEQKIEAIEEEIEEEVKKTIPKRGNKND